MTETPSTVHRKPLAPLLLVPLLTLPLPAAAVPAAWPRGAEGAPAEPSAARPTAAGAATAEPVAADPLARRPAVAGALAVLDLWIGETLAARDLPGLSIAVVHDQELVWAQGYGFADLAARTPATPATLYRLGSVTKLFTATAAMQLRDAGKLRLDDPVAHHLPWFAVESEFADAPAITIRHLLTHTSGLPREAAFPYWTDHVFPGRDDVIAALPGQRAVFAPESRIKYSNLGVALLGEVVAAASGEPYAAYLERHLFAPLGMASTTVAPTAEHHRRRATSYLRRMPDGRRDAFDYYDTAALAPAANGVSSVLDLARFAMLQFRDPPADGAAQVLAGSTLREMRRPHRLADDWQSGRGLGFAVRRRTGKTLAFHGGWIGGNRSHFLLAPDGEVAVIVAINADDGDPGDFAYAAYDLLGPAIAEAVAPPPEPPGEKRADPAWRRYLGTYADPWHWEVKVLIVDGELVLYEHDYPPADDPAEGLTRLEPVAEHTFRMPDGEPLVFELDAAGRVERIRRRHDYLYPVPPGPPPAAPRGER